MTSSRLVSSVWRTFWFLVSLSCVDAILDEARLGAKALVLVVIERSVRTAVASPYLEVNMVAFGLVMNWMDGVEDPINL